MQFVYTLKNQVEENIITEALKEAGIRFVIRPFNDSAYDGIFMSQKGYGQVLVEDKDKEIAKETIEGALG